MFDNVPIKKRLYVILGLIGFVFLISLLYGVQVLGIYDKVNELEQKTALIEDADLEIVNRQVRLKELGAEISQLQSTGLKISSHAGFMDYVEKQCAELDLQLFVLPRESVEKLEGYRVAEIEFAVEGMYHDILNLMYQMEFKDRVGSVSYVRMERKSVRIRNTRKDILLATIRINRLLNERTTTNETS